MHFLAQFLIWVLSIWEWMIGMLGPIFVEIARYNRGEL